MWKPDVCIYHFPCDDGYGAAWAVHRKWGDAIDYRPSNYGQRVPDDEIDGKNILIADFSFKPDILRAMAARAASVVLLDHHKSAAEDLAGFPVNMVGARHDAIERSLARVSGPDCNIVISFDMERSGAMMTWQFCFPDQKVPQLVRHLQDRDLWKNKLEQTRCLSLYLRSHDYDFKTWTDIANALDDIGGTRGNVLAEAHAIERFYDRKLAEILPTATLKAIGKWKGVPVAHAPYAFASDLAHEMLKAHPDAPFAAVVVDSYGQRTYSLRSEDGRQDVSEVARTFGGGGHRNAAGFRVPC